MELAGKTAVVTGSTGGLGWRICRALAREQVNLCMVYNSSEKLAAEYLESVQQLGVKAITVQADVTTDAGIDRMTEAAEAAFGGFDILILDAAYNEPIPFSDLETLDREKWEFIQNFNLTAPYMAVRRAAPVMKRRGGGRIVTISSVAGLQPSGSSIAYAVSKAGLIHLTKCLAVALAPEIQVNSVAPGLMDATRMTEKLDRAFVERVEKGALLKRTADKDDVADAVVMFCRTDSTTGQTLVIDAGRVFH